MERQPAYKRLGFELDGPVEEQAPSTMSLDNDSNNGLFIFCLYINIKSSLVFVVFVNPILL